MLALTLAMFAMSLLVYLIHIPPGVFVIVTGAYVIGTGIWGYPRIRRAQRKIRHLKQGRDGERAVAEYLDTLRDEGFRVLHDIQGDNFNVDHVLIGPRGIYTVETKTISKPNGSSTPPRVTYDGEGIRLGTFEPSRNPVIQAKAQATWLRHLLEESTGKSFTVRPVVVFPGWYVEQPKGTDPLVWVIEPKMLQGRLQNQPIFMTPEDVSLCTFHLKRFVRAGSSSGARALAR